MTDMPTRLPRALVLHADPGALRDVRRSLEARRFVALSARDGASGLELLLDHLLELDALVIDADLPGRDARSFARLIRHAGGERDLAIVVLARDLSPRLRAELLSLGVDAVLDERAGSRAAADAVLEAVCARGWPGSGSRAAPPPAPAAHPGPGERWALSIRRLSPLAA